MTPTSSVVPALAKIVRHSPKHPQSITIAARLATTFATVENLSTASKAELAAVPGMGGTNADAILAALELGQACSVRPGQAAGFSVLMLTIPAIHCLTSGVNRLKSWYERSTMSAHNSNVSGSDHTSAPPAATVAATDTPYIYTIKDRATDAKTPATRAEALAWVAKGWNEPEDVLNELEGQATRTEDEAILTGQFRSLSVKPQPKGQHVSNLDMEQALTVLRKYDLEVSPYGDTHKAIERACASVRALFLRVTTLETAASELLLSEHEGHDHNSHEPQECNKAELESGEKATVNPDDIENCPICIMRRVLDAGFTKPEVQP